jgi:hypothetical protein
MKLAWTQRTSRAAGFEIEWPYGTLAPLYDHDDSRVRRNDVPDLKSLLNGDNINTMSASAQVSHGQLARYTACLCITMDDSTLLAIFAFGSCAFILLAHRLSTSRNAKRLPLPPGPNTSWFRGIQLPQTHQWLTFARWKETFGSVQSTLIFRCTLTQRYLGGIIHIYTFGNPIIILNTAEAADLLLDKRGNKYSSRPQRTMIYEL